MFCSLLTPRLTVCRTNEEDTLAEYVDAMLDGEAVSVPNSVLEQVFARVKEALLVMGVIIVKGNYVQAQDGTWTAHWRCSHYNNSKCRCLWRVTLTSAVAPKGDRPKEWTFDTLPDPAIDHEGHDVNGDDVKRKLKQGESEVYSGECRDNE